MIQSVRRAATSPHAPALLTITSKLQVRLGCGSRLTGSGSADVSTCRVSLVPRIAHGVWPCQTLLGPREPRGEGYNKTMFDTHPFLNAFQHRRYSSPLLRLWLLSCATLPVPVTYLQAAAPQPEMRYEIGLTNGARQQADRITGWEPAKQSVRLDNHQWSPSDPTLRWIFDRQSEMAGPLEAWLETWTGDRLPGNVIGYSDGRKEFPSQPPHLVIRSVTATRPPRQRANALIRVRAASVRRIVWQNEGHAYQPSTVWSRDGRRIPFRALRWGNDSVTLLADDGRHTIPWSELAELNFPKKSVWSEVIDELAILNPEGAAQLLQFETSRGVVATTSWQRQRVLRPPDHTKASYWMQGVQPAWSLDVLWLRGDQIPMRRFFDASETPLSRIRPTMVRQHSPLAAQGRPWQRDRNVEGGWLESGPGVFGWGFGIHATNELRFELPTFVTAVSGFVGLDALAGAGGCVQAKVRIESATTETLFQTPVIVGCHQAYALGRLEFPSAAAPRTLVLQVDFAHTARPAHADPLDIRDSADWLDPTLHFDRDAIQQRVAEQTREQLFACRGWQWQIPAETRLHFHNIWDELSQADSRFALSVAVEGPKPLRFVRQIRHVDLGQQLIITVSCPLQANPPVRIEVLTNGVPLKSFVVPVLDRDHIELAPQTISLQSVIRRDEPNTKPANGTKATEPASIEFEIRQYAGDLDAPVQWHAIEFR